MVGFVPDLAEGALKVCAHLAPRRFQDGEHARCDHRAPIFWDEDQVSMELIEDVSSSAKIACTIHRPSHSLRVLMLKAFRFRATTAFSPRTSRRQRTGSGSCGRDLLGAPSQLGKLGTRQ